MQQKIQEILLIEDDLFTSRVISTFFEEKGVIVHQCKDIGAAFNKASGGSFQCVILDLNLPSGQSLQHLHKLKSVAACPIIMYTANKREIIEIDALEKGVDDFVLKSRGIEVLYRRVKALTQLNISEKTEVELNLPFNFDFQSGILTSLQTNNSIELTKKEYNIFSYMLKNQGTLTTREELSYLVNGYSYDGWTRSLDLLICRLRNKLKKDFSKTISISTVRGKGYILTVLQS